MNFVFEQGVLKKWARVFEIFSGFEMIFLKQLFVLNQTVFNWLKFYDFSF